MATLPIIPQTRAGMWCCEGCSCMCDETDAFCPRCGMSCAASAGADPAPAWDCASCGMTCDATDAFCTRCGAKSDGTGPAAAPPDGGMAGMSAPAGATRITAANVTTRTADLPPLQMRASVVPSSVDPERRTVAVTWTTGARVLRGFFDQYWEELSLDPKSVRMGRLQSGTSPVLNAHNAESLADVIGVVESATLDAKRGGSAVLRFDAGPDGAEAFRKISSGILRNVSVGYRVFAMEKIADGEGKIPVYRAVDWEPHEISPVPIGADAGAVTRAAGAAAATTNVCHFIQERSIMADDTTPPAAAPQPVSPALAATRAASAARIESAAAIAAARQAASEEAIAAERVRSVAIRRLAKQSKLGEAWATSLIEAGTSVDEARAAAFDQMVSSDGEFATDGRISIGAGDDERDKWIRGASAWLWARCGYTDLIRAAQKALPDHPGFKGVSLDPGEFRGMTPLDLARQSLDRHRVNTRGMDAMPLVGAAFMHRSPANFQTTSDFAVLLENVLNKVMLGGYATQENTWMRFCKQTDVKDFRPSPQYRTGSLPSLLDIAEHGEYKTGAIPDGAKYTISTGRKGIKFSLSREVIVNDDMGAMMQLAEGFGQASARTIENNVYALLTANAGLGANLADGNPFFFAARGNINAVGSVLSIAGLDADRVQLRTQRDPSGLDFLDLRPDVLLVADSLYGQAQVINESQYDTDKIANGRLGEPNRVRGLFREVVGSPRLAAPRRYLFAQTGDAIVVSYLIGYGRAPNIEAMNGWNVDGVEWRVTLYAKAQFGDPKSAETNAGV